MIKHNYNKRYILDGKTYEPKKDGFLYLPVEVKSLRPVKEEKESKPDYKQLAIDAGITGEDLKKFMKKNTENKIKQLDSSKEA